MKKGKQSLSDRATTEGIRIAAYMRLSKADHEDERASGESNSISMQRIFIHKYITSHFKFFQIIEYQDDGFSGTSFHRPGVQKLFEDARNERFDCVVVKDLSRFGRDYMEVGAYLEQIFPFLGIRFISINDNYDSAVTKGNTLALDMNFKNLLYDLYSKDLSQKVKTSLWAKKESGQYVSANAPFGYEKAPDDRHMLIICEEEAAIVREIFALALQGVTSSKIAKELNQANIPAPIEFQIRRGKTSRKPKGDRFYWSSNTICHILRNPAYTGDMEYGKTEKGQVGGRSVLKARADWKIIRNHHAPIIARKDFEQIQKRREISCGNRKRKASRHPLTGKAVCGCCKCSLQIKGKVNPYFTCANRYVTGLEGCVKKVSVLFLEQMALFRLEEYLEGQNLAKKAIEQYKGDLRDKRANLLRNMRCAKREYSKLKQRHYEGYQLYSLGHQPGFHPLHAEMEEKRETIRKLQEQITRMDERIHMADLGEFLSAGGDGLASEMVERYLDQIVVYHEEDMEIKWKEGN